MFQYILLWIREVLNKMINTTSVREALKVDVALSQPMVEALNIWSLMYENKSTWLNADIKSLNLSAAIASEIARAVTIEMKVEITGSLRADYLNSQYENISHKIREQIEYGCAKGSLILKPYVKGKEIAVDFVQADCFYPISFDTNGDITSIVFSDQKKIGQYYYTRLEYHNMNGNTCTIKNFAFRSDVKNVLGISVPLESIEAWKNLQPEATIQGIVKPLYAYFKYPMANTIDTTSPFGVSCYSRAVNLIEQADIQWSNLLHEFDTGKRALYVDELAFGKDTNGLPKLPNKRLYRTLKTAGSIGKEELFEDFTPTLREANILAGLDAILKQIEFSCGLAQGTISDPNTVALTATEIKMSKQRTYATITDTQKAVENCLNQLFYAMDIWATIAKLSAKGSYEVVYYFDDSIVADHDSQFSQDSQAIGMQVMSKIEFRMRNYGETEDVARKAIALVTAEQPDANLNNPTGD